MIQDPADELLAVVRRVGDEPTAADLDRVRLARRRFGLALPPPFVAVPGAVPVRPAVPLDGPAIAAVKWRSWGRAYRGIVPDAFLDSLDVVPSPGYWVGRAVVPPSRRHHLLVAGTPGVVVGFVDVVPARDADLDATVVAEIATLYVDPCAQDRGIGAALLDAAVSAAAGAGDGDLRLWAASANDGGRRFYEREGWILDGAAQRVALTPEVGIDEVRYRRSI